MLRGGITTFIGLLFAFSAAELRAEAGAALGGAAAIVGAVAPMAVAGAQAGADKYMSALSAEVAMYQTDRYSQVSEFQAKLQQETALALAGMQYAVNGYNQMQTSNRLQMQLDAVARSSALTQKMNSESLKREYSLLNRQLDLQSKAIDQQTKLTMLQSGSYSLFATTNSGSTLATRSYNLARPSKTTATPSDRLLSSLGTKPEVSTSSLSSRIGSLANRTRVTATQGSLEGGAARGRVGTLPSTAMRRAMVGADWPRHVAREVAAEAPQAIGAGRTQPSSGHHGHNH